MCELTKKLFKTVVEPKICVIGAGPSGITAAKNLLQVGLSNLIVFERSNQVGGNWVYSEKSGHSSVFETTHIISSKTLSQYEDFPMPDHFPDYPSHEQLRQYFNDYAEHFGVKEKIKFETLVTQIKPLADGKWKVMTNEEDGEYIFDFVLVCNGHHWNPRMPEYPGTFTGELIHSHDFKNNKGFENKRVLVIGGGNSACDIAVETGRVSNKTSISMRRGYYFIPKFILGKPSDTFGQGLDWIPIKLRSMFTRFLLWISVGDLGKYGLKKPEHDVFECHPVVNSELLYFIRHGKIEPKGDIEKFDGKYVVFKDGSKEIYDVVIAATGYKITFPFLDTQLVDYSEGPVELYKHVFHPKLNSLFFIGLVQPLGCIWPLSDLQSKLVANHLIGKYNLPSNIQDEIEKALSRRQKQFMNTPRHNTEVFYHDYRKELLKEIPKDAPQWMESATI
jgi:cation diffusion facilitator CzcD-associated flavoprotein CzcO